MEYSFLLPRCGAKNPSLRNHHGTKFPEPDVGHQYIYCEDTQQNTMNKWSKYYLNHIIIA